MTFTDADRVRLSKAFRNLAEAARDLSLALGIASAPLKDKPRPIPEPVESDHGETIGHRRAPRVAAPSSEPGELSKTDRKILVSLAQLGKPASLLVVGFVGSFASGTGPVGTSLAKLRRAEFIEGSKDALRITPRGLAAIGDFPPLPRGHELFEYWRNKVKSPGGKILLSLRQDNNLSIEEIGHREGFAPGTGPVGTSLALLRRLGFIEGSKDALRLTENFRRAIEPTIGVFDTSSGKSVRVDRQGNIKT